MRILLVTETFFPASDATTTTVKALADRLIDRGHEVRFVAPAPGLRCYRGSAVVRISPGTLVHEYGNRSEMLRRACVQAARDRVRIWNRRWSDRWHLAVPERRGPALLLPDHEQDLSHERQWAAWRELSRGDVAMLPGMGVALEGERRAVEWAREQLGRERDELATDALLALVTGVITRMVDTEDPWTLEHASRVLESAWS